MFASENCSKAGCVLEGALPIIAPAVALIGIVIILEARPIYSYMFAMQCEETPGLAACLGFDGSAERSEMVVGFGLAALVCGAATLVPIEVALRKLEA